MESFGFITLDIKLSKTVNWRLTDQFLASHSNWVTWLEEKIFARNRPLDSFIWDEFLQFTTYRISKLSGLRWDPKSHSLPAFSPLSDKLDMILTVMSGWGWTISTCLSASFSLPTVRSSLYRLIWYLNQLYSRMNRYTFGENCLGTVELQWIFWDYWASELVLRSLEGHMLSIIL